jgi:hypothetical protein
MSKQLLELSLIGCKHVSIDAVRAKRQPSCCAFVFLETPFVDVIGPKTFNQELD